jgi:hypothetical protein
MVLVRVHVVVVVVVVAVNCHKPDCCAVVLLWLQLYRQNHRVVGLMGYIAGDCLDHYIL